MPATFRLLVAVAVLTAPLLGCANRPPGGAVDTYGHNDPLEPTNRYFFRIDNAIDRHVVHPTASAYVRHVPPPVRSAVHNFLQNLDSPVLLANDMLEGKPRRAGDTLMRALINTTLGVGGLFDLATGWGYPFHNAGFALTLGLWGVGTGPYLYLPVLGPSDLRDTVGGLADGFAEPIGYVGQGTTGIILHFSALGLHGADTSASMLDVVEAIQKTALDPYATFRSLYFQNRESAVEKLRDDHRATVPAWFAPAPTGATTPLESH